MKIIKIVVLGLLSVVLMGCSKTKPVNDTYNSECFDNDMVSMTVSNIDSSLFCDIAAEIEISPYMNNEQLHLQLCEWDSDYIEKIGNTIFDKGLYEEVYPYELSDYGQLEEQEAFIVSILENTCIENAFSSQLDEIRNFKSSKESISYQLAEKMGLIYSIICTIETQEDEHSFDMLYSKFDICRLRGKINDVYCELIYFDGGGRCYINITPYVRTSDRIQYYSNIQDDDINVCNYDESKQLILNISDAVAGKNVQIAETANRNVLVNSAIQMDGYRFVCVSKYSDIFYANDSDYTTCFESGYSAVQSKLIIDVNQFGIDQITIKAPFYEYKGKTQIVELKSIDEINECAVNFISNELKNIESLDLYDKSNILVNKILFENLIVNKNGNYICTPTCVYYKKNDMSSYVSSYGINNPESVPWFAVDANDGTIYKFGVFLPGLL